MTFQDEVNSVKNEGYGPMIWRNVSSIFAGDMTYISTILKRMESIILSNQVYENFDAMAAIIYSVRKLHNESEPTKNKMMNIATKIVQFFRLADIDDLKEWNTAISKILLRLIISSCAVDVDSKCIKQYETLLSIKSDEAPTKHYIDNVVVNSVCMDSQLLGIIVDLANHNDFNMSKFKSEELESIRSKLTNLGIKINATRVNFVVEVGNAAQNTIYEMIRDMINNDIGIVVETSHIVRANSLNFVFYHLGGRSIDGASLELRTHSKNNYEMSGMLMHCYLVVK